MKIINGISLIVFSFLLFNHAQASETFYFICEDKTEIHAAFPNKDQAIIYYKENLYLLNSAISGSGARYIGENWQFWSKGNEVYWAKLKPNEDYSDDLGLTCKETKSKTD